MKQTEVFKCLGKSFSSQNNAQQKALQNIAAQSGVFIEVRSTEVVSVYSHALALCSQPGLHPKKLNQKQPMSGEAILFLLSPLMTPQLDYCIQLWDPQSKKTMNIMSSEEGHQESQRNGAPLL